MHIYFLSLFYLQQTNKKFKVRLEIEHLQAFKYYFHKTSKSIFFPQ